VNGPSVRQNATAFWTSQGQRPETPLEGQKQAKGVFLINPCSATICDAGGINGNLYRMTEPMSEVLKYTKSFSV